MVVVLKEPETEPILGSVCFDETDCSLNNEANSCREQAYKELTRIMTAAPFEVTSFDTCLNLLTTAIQLKDAALVKRCVDYLKTQLHKENALMVYIFLRKCQTPESDPNPGEPSAPPMVEDENAKGGNCVANLVEELRENCLRVIDVHADHVLKQKELIALCYKDMYDIVSRDTLHISSERCVFDVVYNWGVQECTRMTLSNRHLPEVLRELRFTPRYGLMTKKEFKNKMLEILDERDWRHIKFYLEEKSKNRPVNELPYKMSQYRLGGRTSSGSSFETNGKCDKCIINVLACWTAVFD